MEIAEERQTHPKSESDTCLLLPALYSSSDPSARIASKCGRSAGANPALLDLPAASLPLPPLPPPCTPNDSSRISTTAGSSNPPPGSAEGAEPLSSVRGPSARLPWLKTGSIAGRRYISKAPLFLHAIHTNNRRPLQMEDNVIKIVYRSASR